MECSRLSQKRPQRWRRAGETCYYLWLVLHLLTGHDHMVDQFTSYACWALALPLPAKWHYHCDHEVVSRSWLVAISHDVLCRAVLMDVRLAHKFDAHACPNSQNFPLYQPISGMGLAANIRRAGFTFFGVFGTERNTQWLEQVEAAVPKGMLSARPARPPCCSSTYPWECHGAWHSSLLIVARGIEPLSGSWKAEWCGACRPGDRGGV